MESLRIRDEVLRAAAEIGREVQELDVADSERFWTSVAGKFARKNVGLSLWEHLRQGVSIHDPDGWQRIAEHVGQQQAVLFFNPNDETAMFVTQDGDHLTSILGNSYQYEFYVSDMEQSYLLVHTHHDVLIAAGAAAAWLKQTYPDHHEHTT
jgi:hypothetical protein